MNEWGNSIEVDKKLMTLGPIVRAAKSIDLELIVTKRLSLMVMNEGREISDINRAKENGGEEKCEDLYDVYVNSLARLALCNCKKRIIDITDSIVKAIE